MVIFLTNAYLTICDEKWAKQIYVKLKSHRKLREKKFDIRNKISVRTASNYTTSVTIVWLSVMLLQFLVSHFLFLKETIGLHSTD